jgi:hypothetical protein
MAQLSHHSRRRFIRPAEQRVAIIELLDRVEARLGRQQIERFDS